MAIRLAFTDFEPGFEPEGSLLHRLMAKHADVEIVDENPDICFFSNFGWRYLFPNGHFRMGGPDCIKLFFTGEAVSANFNHCDYAIGFDHMEFGDRYLRCPLYTFYDEYPTVCVPRVPLTLAEVKARPGFCSFVVSAQSSGDPTRVEVFRALDAARGVASGGQFLRNTDALAKLEASSGRNPAKAQFLGQHRFSIAFENASVPGYCTEKIVQAFAARTIPIYWGDPTVTQEFNPDAFVNAHDFETQDALIAEVLRLDDDPDACLAMLNAPVFQPGRSGVHMAELDAFLGRLATTPLTELRRRPRYGAGERIDFRAARVYRKRWYMRG